MALTKIQKQKILDELKDKIARQKAMVFVGIEKVKVKDLSALRKKLKLQENELKVAKKTLLKLALKENKIDFDLKELPGEVALVFGYKDEILPAKTAYEASKENENLKILAGFIENKFYPAEEIIALAQIPSREELFARVAGGISAPLSGFVNVLQGKIRSLVYIFSQIKPST